VNTEAIIMMKELVNSEKLNINFNDSGLTFNQKKQDLGVGWLFQNVGSSRTNN
jgi:hypothetical protein